MQIVVCVTQICVNIRRQLKYGKINIRSNEYIRVLDIAQQSPERFRLRPLTCFGSGICALGAHAGDNQNAIEKSPSCGGNGVRICMRGGGTERDRLSEWQQKTKREHTSYPQYLDKEKNQSFLNFLSTHSPDSVHGVTLMRCTSRFR